MSRGRLLANAGLAAFVAVMLAGPAATIFPSTLRWASGAACPAGTAPAPKRFRASYSRPGETQIALVCVAPDGTTSEHTLAAMGGLWVMYFVAASPCFRSCRSAAVRAEDRVRSPPARGPSAPCLRMSRRKRAS